MRLDILIVAAILLTRIADEAKGTMRTLGMIALGCVIGNEAIAIVSAWAHA